MKNKKLQAAYALLFAGLFLSTIYVSGCDSTKGKDVPSSPSGDSLTISASPTTVASNGSDLSVITATV